eukprot:superscaffoldBa00006312_g21382
MWAGPKYLLVFGGVCPSVTMLIARSLPALNLVQVSFAATPPSLSNRKWYGNLFSTVPSDRALNQVTVKLLQRYKWTRVSIVTQEGPRHSEMKKDLIRQLLKADVQVVSTVSFYDDACSSLKKLKERDVRIIIGQFEDDSASEVFCCAYRLNLFGARYQWIVTGGGTAGWRLGWQFSGCTANNLLTAADGSIRLQIRQLSSTNAPGVSGRTPQNYQDAYLRELIQERSKVSPLHAFAYDAVWVAAKALSQVMEAVKHREKYSIKRNVTVSEEEFQKMLLEVMKQTQFEGVTGPVFFRNGERMTLIELIQFQGSGPAKDQTEVRLQQRLVSLLLYSIVSSVATVTIIITLTILCFIIINRKHWLLRASGGSQDELLLLGVLLSSASVLISGLDEALLSDRTLELLCSVRLWILSVGHTVGFSVLFIKTWRVYSLCSINQRQQSSLQPAGRVLLWMFLLDVFVLTSWQILDPLRRVVMQHRLESDPADQDVIIQPHSEHCSSINMELWLTAVYGYKGPLLGLGCFLAWSIRTVQVDHPAVHSKHLTLSMFALTVFSVLGVSGSLLTSHNPPVQFCLSSALILGCNIFILSLLFGTKFLYLWSNSSELQSEAAEEGAEEQLRRLNQQLKSRTTQPIAFCRPAPMGVLLQPTVPPLQFCRQGILSLCSWDAPPSPQRRRSIAVRPTSAFTMEQQDTSSQDVQQKPGLISNGGDPGAIREWSPPVILGASLSSSPDLSKVLLEYHDFCLVFSKAKARSLPLHRPYDCAIDFLPGTSPPKGCLYSLSEPERKAKETYINDSLAAESGGIWKEARTHPPWVLSCRCGDLGHRGEGIPLSGSELRRLLSSPVFEAELMIRPLQSENPFLRALGHSGVRVTLADGSQWLIHKGRDFGVTSQTVVTDTRYMSSKWR